MATTLKRGPHHTVVLPVTADTASGSPVVVGGITGVALTDEGGGGNADGNATVGLGGVTSQPVGTTTTVAVGGAIYITSAYALTPSDGSGSNKLFGYALEAKGSTAGEVIDILLVTV